MAEKKEWTVAAPMPEDLVAVYHDLDPLVAQLLYNRGLRAREDVQKFLGPRYEDLYSPFLFTHMEKAAARIWQAMEAGERVVIYGDYDADAVTANALLQQTFRYLGFEVNSYVPDRFTEGYGLNLEAMETIKAQGAKVIITVDCGTNSVEAAEFCQKYGMDLIITDHHEITGEIPYAFALINPKNPHEAYPDRQITGVGVAYKLAVALLTDEARVSKRLGSLSSAPAQTHFDKWLLDLVAIGTVADCHSLLGENRILVKYGLVVLAKTKWPGLRALLNLIAQSKNGPMEFDTYLLGFQLAPRINAAGRLEHADQALATLMADAGSATEKATDLERINLRRQELTERMISEAREQAILIADLPILVLASPDWHKGIVGIVAGRLASEFHKPVIILEQGEKESTGSMRSFAGFDAVAALGSVSDCLLKFGGHQEAAGLTLATARLEEFRSRLVRYAAEVSLPVGSDETGKSILEVDAVLQGEDISLDTFDLVSGLAPFGAGNPSPKFLLEKAVVASLRLVGKTQNHVQIVLDAGGIQLQGIMFSKAYLASSLQSGTIVDVIFALTADTWNGIRRVKLKIEDIVVRD